MEKQWTKSAALARVSSNERLKALVSREPRLKPIIDSAAAQQNTPGYHRINTYYALKKRASALVGWESPNPALNQTEHFDPVMDAIIDLLPPDDSDLYPEGKPLPEDDD